MSYKQFIDLMAFNLDFRVYFNDLLEKLPFKSFRWETPPVNTNSVDQPFKFAIINSPELLKPADTKAFSKYLKPKDSVNSFLNSGKNATLVIPTLPNKGQGYAHLASFVREAPKDVIDLFWQQVAEEVNSKLSSSPLWLNTAGAGVARLHVRLDSKPKYYRHHPYKLF